MLNVPREQVDVSLIMSRYVSYWMSRIPLEDAPFSFSITINGVDQTSTINQSAVFQQLTLTLKRAGSSIGNIMTAASATVVFDGIVNDTGMIAHAPGSNGLPGGYSVYVDGRGVKVALPEKMSLQVAIGINEVGLVLDGIEHIDEDGTVVFAEREISIFHEVLEYNCRRMPLSEVDDWATELQVKYQKLSIHYQK